MGNQNGGEKDKTIAPNDTPLNGDAVDKTTKADENAAKLSESGGTSPENDKIPPEDTILTDKDADMSEEESTKEDTSENSTGDDQDKDKDKDEKLEYYTAPPAVDEPFIAAHTEGMNSKAGKGDGKPSDLKFYIKTAGVLLVIASVMALLLAFVNEVTYRRIDENSKAEFNEAIQDVFPGAEPPIPVEIELKPPVSDVYRIEKDGTFAGYCVIVVPKGFGGGIKMMVATTSNGEVMKVKVIEQGETPGIGIRVSDPDYLAGYTGKSGVLNLGQDIDALAGATVSAKAILEGVNAALAIEGIYGGAD